MGSTVAKAIAGALVAFGAMFETATSVGSVGGEAVTANEWVKVVVATAVAGVLVWAVPNAPTRPTQ